MMDELFFNLLVLLLSVAAAFTFGDRLRARIAKAHLQRELDTFQDHGMGSTFYRKVLAQLYR